jgi:hypothetical protein
MKVSRRRIWNLSIRLSKIVVNSSNDYFTRMKCRYFVFLISYVIANLIIAYYILVFCAVFPLTSTGWIISSILALFVKFLFGQMLNPVFGGLFIKVINVKG